MPKNQKQNRHVVKTSILERIVLQSVILTTLTAIILSFSAFVTAEMLIKQRVFSQLSSIVNAKEDRIVSRINTDREHTALLASGENMQTILQARRGSADLKALLERMQGEGVSVLGIAIFTQGKAVVASTGLPVDEFAHGITATTMIPSNGSEGWDGYTIYSPIYSAGKTGVLGVRYSMKALLESVFDVPSLGETGEVLLGKKSGDELVFLNNEYAPGKRSPLSLGSFEEQLSYREPMAIAIESEEGVEEAEDYRGNNVYVAYRSLPLLGWGLVVKIHEEEAMSGTFVMALALLVKSVFLLLIAAYASIVLARRLTAPLRHLTKKMGQLGPDHWSLGRTIKTGDEVEVLERIASGMASRLKKIYDNLEDEVQKRTELLKNQYLKDRVILDTIDHGVMTVNAKGRVTDANPAALQVLKYTGKECVGFNVGEALDIRVHHKKVKGMKHPALAVLKKKKTVQSTPEQNFSIMRADNILIPVLLVVKPLMDGKKLLGAIIVFQDVTEQRRVDYLKSEFISLASHQLRTPLSSLQWHIELLNNEGKVSKDQQEYINEMSIAAKRMSNLIDSLLRAARLEGGDITPHNNPVNLTSVITDLGEDLRSLGKDKKLSCKITVPKKKVEIETDPVLLHVVFKNLFSNAIKYTLSGGEVSVTMVEKKASVEIAVTDSGIGIPAADQKRLFERLFRADNVRKMDTDGNGLGLYITKMIVKSLGGTISVKSTENKGSTFTVKLPIKAKKAKKAPAKKKK
jgi:PAS domain S-box-containing protein